MDGHLIGTANDEIGQKIGQWFADKKQMPVTAPYTAICWFKNQQPVAAALFNGYNGSSIEGHFYGPNNLTRFVISSTYKYVFEGLKCNVFIAIVPRTNAFKKLLPRMGFKYLIVIPKYFGDTKAQDGIMFAINAQQARKWIK